jgi:DNA ligase-1
MKAFADLYQALDETNKTNEKVVALERYFQSAPPNDAAWALFFLSGRRIKQLVGSTKLRNWAIEASGIPEWLFNESYDAVGDSGETIALLLPSSSAASDRALTDWIETVILPLKKMDEAEQRQTILNAWNELDSQQRFVFNKLLTGSFRVGVSQLLLTRALSNVSGIANEVLAHRLMGAWEANPAFYAGLMAQESTDADMSRPYPFFLAYPLEDAPESLGELGNWQAEWKWDGIRAQLIKRAGAVALWSRGEELITDRFPEITDITNRLPDGTVIDGEILPWLNGVMPFAQLQRRIGRKTLSKQILAEVPAVFMSYDLLEYAGTDLRERPMAERRAELEAVVKTTEHPALKISPLVDAETWETLLQARENSRDQNVEGIMLKRKSSPYRTGRVRGDWWKWKINPYSVDAVLIYAQRGTGKRASLYTDYTFALWDEGQLVPFTKAYSGLNDEEIRQVDSFVRRNTLERFGPVRTVKQELVFEIAFEGIQRSPRHKSGVAVRFPRILRWRTDKKIEDADSMDRLWALLPKEQPTP